MGEKLNSVISSANNFSVFISSGLNGMQSFH